MEPKRTSLKRIGIFGGTFDPIHIGHLIVASEVGNKFKLDRVVFVPTAHPPHKRYRLFASPEDRLKMVEMAIRSNRRFVVSDFEQKREFSYTVETLEHFKKAYPEARLYLIIGADNITEIKDWRHPERILRLAEVVAVSRPDHRLSPARDRYSRRVRFFEGPEIGISSTDIRKKIGSGKPFRYLVPERVARYITAKGLYSATRCR